MPAFLPDGGTLLYVISRFYGHYSPIARPRKHDFDIVKVPINPDGPVTGATPIELTQQGFFDLLSLAVSPDGKRFLVSTSAYPIGSLLEEYEIAKPLRVKSIYQPHVPGAPSFGPAFGDVAYAQGGMEILFTAATEGKNGNYDYNVYKMSAVTGGDIAELSHHSGMIDRMIVDEHDGEITVLADGHAFSLDPQSGVLKEERVVP